MKGIFAFKIKTVGTFDPRTKGFRRAGKWYKKGVADILGIYRGRFFAIEVKKPKDLTPKGRLSENQKIFLKEVQDNGGIAIVAHSIEDVEQGLGEAENEHESPMQNP